ncbi:MAG: glycosyltransferase family 1 protein [Chloroflexi bacterium]|nr:MAG: glycosyltransferase family 1 protein [Chloroflexota bacterium]HDN79134.1 glycosyltransferase family 1 protein [Chloroflexota bacterium]
MRVLMISWEYPPHVVGGLGKHVMELAPALVRNGVELHLLTPAWKGGEPYEEIEGVKVYRVQPSPDKDDIHTVAWKTNLRLEEKAQSLWDECDGFDIIHVHDWLTAFAGCALKRTRKTPLLATIHATERGRGRGHLHGEVPEAINSTEWWLTYEAWRVICCSKHMAWEVREYFQVPEDKIDVIPNGISTDRFDRWEGVDLTAFRNMYALPEERIVFYVGRLVHEKGVHILIEAIPHVLARFPAAKFVIAGTGPMAGHLRHRAWELGVSQKVLFTGFIPDEDRDRLFKIADVAVFPSLYEPFGIVALEAMAARCPVVVSEVGGLKEVVRHSETGITVYPDNVESLVWGILHTLEHPEWTRARVENAYREVVEKYNWDRIARMTVRVYRRIIEERRKVEW